MMPEKTEHKGASGKQVEAMFDSISGSYDRLNRILSMGTDRRWRSRAVSIIGQHIRPVTMLDVATGTGDLAIEALKLGPGKVTGIDISTEDA